jgi:glyoxylase-like metal-dependent hydrolase (beta-lactamase superfamily II)
VAATECRPKAVQDGVGIDGVFGPDNSSRADGTGRTGPSVTVLPLFEVPYEAGATLVMVGHDHNCERFAPQDPRGNADGGDGMPSLTVRTAGAELRPPRERAPNSEARNSSSWGVPKLSLHPASLEGAFLSMDGAIADSEGDTCVERPAPRVTLPPLAVPSNGRRRSGNSLISGDQGARTGETLMKLSLAWFAIAAVVSTMLGAAPTLAQSEVKREITHIAGDLYRFQNKFHVSVFLVTPEGVIAADPINAEAATWLEAEIRDRFGMEVKYLVLSHDHADHSAGGEVFADTATVVTHENAKRTIIGEKRPTAIPDVTFSDRMSIELGGKVVDLYYLGRSHSDNMIVMHFPAERALFTVDFVSVGRLPYMTLSDAYFPDWIEAIRRVEAIDFDILIPGHGPVGTKADASDHRAYLEDLYTAVLAAARAGQSLEEMQASILLEVYKDWGQYEAWRPLNIEGMSRQIGLHRRGN